MPTPHASWSKYEIGGGIVIDLDDDGDVLTAQWPNLTIAGSLLCSALGCRRHGYIVDGKLRDA